MLTTLWWQTQFPEQFVHETVYRKLLRTTTCIVWPLFFMNQEKQMDAWQGFYNLLNIIGHTEPGCQQREISDMDETLLRKYIQSSLKPGTTGSQAFCTNHWTTAAAPCLSNLWFRLTTAHRPQTTCNTQPFSSKLLGLVSNLSFCCLWDPYLGQHFNFCEIIILRLKITI